LGVPGELIPIREMAFFCFLLWLESGAKRLLAQWVGLPCHRASAACKEERRFAFQQGESSGFGTRFDLWELAGLQIAWSAFGMRGLRNGVSQH